MAFHETHKRTLVKTIAWRVAATVISWSSLYFYTEKIGQSTKIAITAAAAGTVAYYFYERLWNGITWGREHRK